MAHMFRRLPKDPLAALVANTKLHGAAAKSGHMLLNNMIAVKALISMAILIGAVTISALYNKTKAGDQVSKNRLKYISQLWFGEQSGMAGTMVILWLPTLLFLTCMQLLDFEAMMKNS